MVTNIEYPIRIIHYITSMLPIAPQKTPPIDKIPFLSFFFFFFLLLLLGKK